MRLVAGSLIAVLTFGAAAQADPWKDESGKGRGGPPWARQGGGPPDWARGKGVWDGHFKHGKHDKDKKDKWDKDDRDWDRGRDFGPGPYGYVPPLPERYDIGPSGNVYYEPNSSGYVTPAPYSMYGSYGEGYAEPNYGGYAEPNYVVPGDGYRAPLRSGYGRVEFWWQER